MSVGDNEGDCINNIEWLGDALKAMGPDKSRRGENIEGKSLNIFFKI